jgi:tetratricopeptide (TPR) repeat protein
MNAKEHNDLGQASLANDDLEKAVFHFTRSVELEPDWATPAYNLGLCYKFLKNWAKSLEWNRRAHLLDPDDDASYWNLAMAAVAENDWEQAGLAFKAIGMKLPETDPPWDFQLGLIPIRVSVDENPEVVWCHRLDPVRAQIASVPYPESGRRFGDIVLNDGEPKGYRQSGEREVPVFNELKLLKPSDYHTYLLKVKASSSDKLDKLTEAFEEAGLQAENWTSSVRLLCKACSEGRPHEQHDQELEDTETVEVHFGVASPSLEMTRSVLETWPNDAVLSCERVL